MQKEKQHKAKKSLGQNFLKSEPALKKIIEAGEIKIGETVLEIGPGKGALTKKLLESGAKVIAVEKDNELFEILKIKFAEQITSGSLVLVHEDILEFEISKYKKEIKKYKIIANIPYNITGAILKKFLSNEYQPTSMVVLVQQEVAQRIVARDPRHGGASGKESILSISVKAYGEPKLVMKVPARYFSPAPKVDSAIISIKNISRKNFTSSPAEEKFWEVVKTGFAHKRKKLSSNLKALCQRDTLTELGNKRAEELTLEDWINLAKN
jgi:16S rRNA (adenine1518-N6/adenine1519-N6)-dimethyltransferase